jgi:lysophospholipase L1-like esterase
MPRMITRRDVVTALAGVSGLAALETAAADAQPSARDRADLRIGKGQKLVMIGDSITDVGRARPIGEGRADDALGRGYVMMVDALLGAVYPERMVRAKQTERHVLIDEYERNLAELVTSTKPIVKGLVLMTPFYLEPNRQDAMRATMDKYGAVVKRIAEAQTVAFVDTQAAFDRLLTVYYPATINWDRVHPNPTGAALLARAFLTAIGFDWRRGLEGL